MTSLTHANVTRVIAGAACNLMGDGARGDYRDVVYTAHIRLYAPPSLPVDDPALEAIAALVEKRHESRAAITGDWPAEYAATLMLATFGPPWR